MEEWKVIPGYEGLYEASNLGRIRTVEGKTTSSARFRKRVWKQRILKPKLARRKRNCKFDARVNLWKDGSDKTMLVARLVAMTWCSGYSEGMTVNHIDGDTLNNAAVNLEWVSIAENIREGFRTGLFSTQKQCTLVNEKGEKKTYRSQCEASRNIGRSNGYIANCILRERQILSIDGEKYGLI